MYTHLISDIFDKYIYSSHKQLKKSQSKVCLYTRSAFHFIIIHFTKLIHWKSLLFFTYHKLFYRVGENSDFYKGNLVLYRNEKVS